MNERAGAALTDSVATQFSTLAAAHRTHSPQFARLVIALIGRRRPKPNGWQKRAGRRPSAGAVNGLLNGFCIMTQRKRRVSDFARRGPPEKWLRPAEPKPQKAQFAAQTREQLRQTGAGTHYISRARVPQHNQACFFLALALTAAGQIARGMAV
jgi:hypothetical protein